MIFSAEEGFFMPNEMLNEKDIQNLFKDLLLQEDIDGERKLLQESGLNIDEKSLEEFHKKKEELFAFAKENKDKLQKLDVNDMASVSGGIEFLTARNFVSALIGAFVGYVRGNRGRDVAINALIGLTVDALVNVAFDTVNVWLEWDTIGSTSN